MPKIVTFSLSLALFIVLVPLAGQAASFLEPSAATISASASEKLSAEKPSPHLYQARAGARFVKLTMSFMPPMVAASAVVESCAGEFKDGVEFFIYPDLRRVYAEGGMPTVKARLGGDSPTTASTEVQSLSLNFRHNSEVCIKSIRFLDGAGGNVEYRSEAEPVKVERAKGFERIQSAFSEAGIVQALDQELVIRSEKDRWVFRFRSDGTFFVFGTSADDAKSAGRFTALGDFEIESTKKSKITLLLKGRKFVTADPWDGWLCGSQCGDRGIARSTEVSDKIIVERMTTGGFMVRNRAPRPKRMLPFTDKHVFTTAL